MNDADYKRLVEIDDKMLSDKPVTAKEIRERQDILKRHAEGCSECGCKDGNHAQECSIYYNAGYGKRTECDICGEACNEAQLIFYDGQSMCGDCHDSY